MIIYIELFTIGDWLSFELLTTIVIGIVVNRGVPVYILICIVPSQGFRQLIVLRGVI